MTGHCKACKYFWPILDKQIEESAGGKCRRWPPRPFMVKHPKFGPIIVGEWPPVAYTDVCGEYTPKL